MSVFKVAAKKRIGYAMMEFSGNAYPIYDVDKWFNLMRKISTYVSDGVSVNSALKVVTSHLDDQEKTAFIKWYRYYQNKVIAEFKVSSAVDWEDLKMSFSVIRDKAWGRLSSAIKLVTDSNFQKVADKDQYKMIVEKLHELMFLLKTIKAKDDEKIVASDKTKAVAKEVKELLKPYTRFTDYFFEGLI